MLRMLERIFVGKRHENALVGVQGLTVRQTRGLASGGVDPWLAG